MIAPLPARHHGGQRLDVDLDAGLEQVEFSAPDYVVLIVDDLDRSLDFYTGNLGLTLDHRSGLFAQLATGRTRLALFERSAMAETLGRDHLRAADPQAPGFELGSRSTMSMRRSLISPRAACKRSSIPPIAYGVSARPTCRTPTATWSSWLRIFVRASRSRCGGPSRGRRKATPIPSEETDETSGSFKTVPASRGTMVATLLSERGGPTMRIGIGLPAAIPGSAGPALGDWAQAAEDHGFWSVSVIDRLVYDNLDPLVALAAAAARTERVELLTTVLNVPWRRNAVVLAKQLASLDEISGGRLTAGLALGGWPEDHKVVGPYPDGTGAMMDEMLAIMHDVWRGSLVGASGPMPATPPGRPRLLFGGFAPAAFDRAARFGQGWVAPSFGYEQLAEGITAVNTAWEAVGRADRPRIVVERYFCLGTGAAAIAEHYLEHYYGPAYLPHVLADTVTTVDHLDRELVRLRDAGCDDVVMLPCDANLQQVGLLADALSAVGTHDTHDRITA